MGRLKVWNGSAWEYIANILAVRNASATVQEPATTAIVFPDGTVTAQGSGVVRVQEVPTGVIWAKAVYNSNQSLPGGYANTKLVWATEVADTDGMVNLGTSTTRFTCTVAGVYWFNAKVHGNSTDPYLSIWVNNAAYGAPSPVQQNAGAYIELSALLNLAVGDYVEAIYSASGAMTSAWGSMECFKLGSGNVAGLDVQSKTDSTSTLLSSTSTSWTNINTALDLVFPAQVGDKIMLWLNGLSANENVGLYVDAVTIVGGSPVNSVGKYDNSAPPSARGVPGWWPVANFNIALGAPITYTVVAGDLSGGTVTFRLRYASSAAATRSIIASTDYPFRFQGVNLKGGAASRDIGYEFDYKETNSADINITATTAATADTIVTGNGFTADGNTAVWVEFYCASADTPSATSLLFVLYESGTLINASWGQATSVSGVHRWPIYLRRKLTPAAGTRTYSARAWVVSGTGVIRASATYMPAYIRVTKA